jgi:hypothetical protein
MASAFSDHSSATEIKDVSIPPPSIHVLSQSSIDRSSWDSAWYERFPRQILDPNPVKERSSWWHYGYHLKSTETGVARHSKYLWVCHYCVVKNHPLRSNSCSFIAFTSRSIKNHLATHRIPRSGVAKAENTSSDGQTAILRYLQYNLNNPHHQQLIERLKGLYD